MAQGKPPFVGLNEFDVKKIKKIKNKINKKIFYYNII
jgi:hypothetical protein